MRGKIRDITEVGLMSVVKKLLEFIIRHRGLNTVTIFTRLEKSRMDLSM